jgi:3-deoxy-D-manno-octulosonic-acid transferase
MQWLYQLSVNLYHLSIWLASFFNPKAKKWVKGRKNIWNRLDVEAAKSNRWIWFHAASLGEFEQGRSVIEAIRAKYPGFHILLTFFSPSGYDIRKNYEHADCVSYLPTDTSGHAVRLLNTFNPKAIFFIKYEFWFNYLQTIHLKQIPFYYISLKLRPDQYFFKSYGKWFREQFRAVTHFFVQDEQTAELLNGAGFLNTTVTGDTRFDRVVAIAAKAKRFPSIEKFLGNRTCVVWGSTWPQDEKIIIPLINKLPEKYKSILVPHDIGARHIQQIEKQLTVAYQKWSDFDESVDSRVLLVDSIGMLSQLYQYAILAYVGGGFGKQIHNIQEAITFGCPVIIGPKHSRFAEATDLVKLGGAFSINDAEGLENIVNELLTDDRLRHNASEICREYVNKSTGATNAIMRKIEPHFKHI